MAKYEKLVRDKIPEILDAKGVPYTKRIADVQEYKDELIRKLVEEANEFAEAGEPEELADVLEVIIALRALADYEDVDSVRVKKREERGGFNQRIILSGEK